MGCSASQAAAANANRGSRASDYWIDPLSRRRPARAESAPRLSTSKGLLPSSSSITTLDIDFSSLGEHVLEDDEFGSPLRKILEVVSPVSAKRRADWTAKRRARAAQKSSSPKGLSAPLGRTLAGAFVLDAGPPEWKRTSSEDEQTRGVARCAMSHARIAEPMKASCVLASYESDQSATNDPIEVEHSGHSDIQQRPIVAIQRRPIETRQVDHSGHLDIQQRPVVATADPQGKHAESGTQCLPSSELISECKLSSEVGIRDKAEVCKASCEQHKASEKCEGVACPPQCPPPSLKPSHSDAVVASAMGLIDPGLPSEELQERVAELMEERKQGLEKDKCNQAASKQVSCDLAVPCSGDPSDPGLPSKELQQRVAELLRERQRHDEIEDVVPLNSQLEAQSTAGVARDHPFGLEMHGADAEKADWIKFIESRKPVPLNALPKLSSSTKTGPVAAASMPKKCPKPQMLAAAEAALAFPWRAGSKSLMYGCNRVQTLPPGQAAAESKPPRCPRFLPAAPFVEDSSRVPSLRAFKACEMSEVPPPPLKKASRPTSLASLPFSPPEACKVDDETLDDVLKHIRCQKKHSTLPAAESKQAPPLDMPHHNRRHRMYDGLFA